MAGEFALKEWKRREVEFPGRRHLSPTTEENVVDVSREEGLVMEDGDAFSPESMNDLEKRIKEGIESAHATAVVTDGVLSITSTYAKASTGYEVQFTMPAGAFTSISIDGAVMSGVFDTMAEAVDFEAAPGVPVTLVRQNDRAFWNAGGGAKIVVQNASGQEIDYDYIIMRR